MDGTRLGGAPVGGRRVPDDDVARAERGGVDDGDVGCETDTRGSSEDMFTRWARLGSEADVVRVLFPYESERC